MIHFTFYFSFSLRGSRAISLIRFPKLYNKQLPTFIQIFIHSNLSFQSFNSRNDKLNNTHTHTVHLSCILLVHPPSGIGAITFVCVVVVAVVRIGRGKSNEIDYYYVHVFSGRDFRGCINRKLNEDEYT